MSDFKFTRRQFLKVSGVTTLALSLDSLGSLGSSLSIRNNDALETLAGLDALGSVGGVRIIDNEQLSDIGALGNLGSLGGPLNISHNDALESLDGLSALTHVSEELAIYDNVALPTCEVCELVAQLGHDV